MKARRLAHGRQTHPEAQRDPGRIHLGPERHVPERRGLEGGIRGPAGDARAPCLFPRPPRRERRDAAGVFPPSGRVGAAPDAAARLCQLFVRPRHLRRLLSGHARQGHEHLDRDRQRVRLRHARDYGARRGQAEPLLRRAARAGDLPPQHLSDPPPARSPRDPSVSAAPSATRISASTR